MMPMGGMPGGPPMGPQMQPQAVGQPPMVGPPQPPPQAQEKLDNISKVKSLIAPLSNSLSTTLKTAALNLHQNCMVDQGTAKNNVEVPTPRFDKSLEEFYSICDQIELHLKTSIECLNQGKSNQTYLNLQVAPTRTEPIPNQDMNTLTYPQYLSTVRAQVNFAKELHDMLIAAAQNITSSD